MKTQSLAKQTQELQQKDFYTLLDEKAEYLLDYDAPNFPQYEFCEQMDTVEEQRLGKSLLDLIIRIHSGRADKIAAEQVLNDQFILQLQAGDRNMFIQKNQDIENHLLDILD